MQEDLQKKITGDFAVIKKIVLNTFYYDCPYEQSRAQINQIEEHVSAILGEAFDQGWTAALEHLMEEVEKKESMPHDRT
ncbi:hypothetical protein [Liquorilactobacillus satsumensis]|uniref:hypothetical protein n=2 Tax=Liquorilactobacillus satsumensis TaxID=259059 RepID=UPI001E3D2EFD|nr:hypothetical protein [Liquorilactobacillus satsumensis]MCC7667457.1 hypothetical protein [Liquorilactobacillus satsumensis]MCP9357957.1 hypothetical protein [Liquorilactobacillus satsumensis]MCP9371615.1 hypothetical protein [Liquorilactobacillus satsumensis]